MKDSEETRDLDLRAYQDFCNTQFDVIDSIRVENIDKGDRLCKSLALVALIDFISKIVYPEEKKNKDRFTSLLEEYSEWKEGKRISLPILCRQLNTKHHPTFKKALQAKLAAWDDGPDQSFSPVELSQDPSVEDLQVLWFRARETDCSKFQNIVIKASHYHLLYQYRNTLVHEFRVRSMMGTTLGFGENFDESGGYLRLPRSMGQTWEPIYPVALLQNICRKCYEGSIETLRDRPQRILKQFQELDHW